MKENEALALLIRNSKTRARNTDLVTLAHAEEFLMRLYKLGRSELANKIGVSEETLRVYSLASTLPSDVKSLVKARLIDGPEILEVLSRSHDPKRQSEIARALTAYGLGTKDARMVEKFARDNPKLTIEECVSRVLSSKPTVERRYAIVTELQPSTVKVLETRNDDAVKSILTKEGLSEILSFVRLRNIMVLVVGESGFSFLRKIAQASMISIDMVPEELVTRGLRRHEM
jgi:ParB-like chromosome segregation protein Spo0J